MSDGDKCYKEKEGKGVRSADGRAYNFNRAVNEGLQEKVTF